jgi:outer membrane autotransporter protein
MIRQHQPANGIVTLMRRALLACAVLASMSLTPELALAQEAGPIANAGPDRTIADTDGLPGETVTLDGTASLPSVPGQTEITSYVWTNAQGVRIGVGPTPTVRLPDGVNQIRLVVSEIYDYGEGAETYTSSDTVTITVLPTSAPTANAGPDRAVPDTDNEPGELVTLDGSLSTDPDGTIVLYEWFRDGNTPLGSSQSPVLSVRLPDGPNQITLVVHDNVGNTASDTFVVTVGAAEVEGEAFEDLPLNPNERELAGKLDDICSRLIEEMGNLGPAQAPVAAVAAAAQDPLDLLERCLGLLNASEEEQAAALEELGAQEINAVRTQALIFSRTQYEGVMDRLLALRSGDRGISLAGLNIWSDGKLVPAEQIVAGLANLLGGGASADDGDAFGSKLGLWLRGNYGSGEKSPSLADNGFESDQWGFTGGIDYRFTPAFVAGLSFGYGKSKVDFQPIGEGDLEGASWAGSLYGSLAVGNFYIDGVINYADSDYDTTRRIRYEDAFGLVDRTARGSTRAYAISGGVSLGYDFVFGGLTVSPTLGYFFVDTNIDPFAETGAGGLDLIYDEQNYESATGSAALRISYAWKASWGVFIPHVRATYVREFKNAIEVFGVRFASDPFNNSGDPTPPIFVQSEQPDESYFRLAAGFSAQLPFGISGYFEYQRLEGFEFVEYQDFTVGLRFQHIFR